MAPVVTVGIGVATRIQTGQAMFDVAMNASGQDAKVIKLVMKEGQQAQALVEDQLRNLVAPTLQSDGFELLTNEVYRCDGARYALISKPKVLTKYGIDARIQLGTADDKVIDVTIRPKKLQQAADRLGIRGMACGEVRCTPSRGGSGPEDTAEFSSASLGSGRRSREHVGGAKGLQPRRFPMKTRE